MRSRSGAKAPAMAVEIVETKAGGADPRERARAQVLAVSAAGGPAELLPGDMVEVTIGKERFRSYDVGPVVVRGRLKEGEALLAAYSRIRAAAAALFELELQERRIDHAVAQGPETFAKTIMGDET